jgi:superfamily II DNA or RNA helicase
MVPHPQAGEPIPNTNPVQYFPEKVIENVPLVRDTPQGLVTFAGFLHRVYAILTQYGQVTYTDARKPADQISAWLFPAPSTGDMGNLRHRQDEGLAAIWNNDGGLIHCATGYGKTELIAKAALSYQDVPDYQVVIACPDKSSFDNAVTRCRKYGLTPALVNGTKNQRGPLIVASAFSLDKLESDATLKKVRLCLCDEVHRFPAPTMSAPLAKMVNARLFGFSATLKGRSDKGEIMIEALFGKVLCRVDYRESVEVGAVVPIHVIMLQTTGPMLEEGADPTKRSRDCAWRNDARNDIYATLAQQVVALGQTLVITQTLEHALNIYRRLPPGFIFMYGTHPEAKIRAEENKRERQRAEEREQRQISSIDMNGNLSQSAFAPDRNWQLKKAKQTLELMNQLGIEKLSPSQKRELQRAFAAGEYMGAVATHVWGTAVDFPQLQFVFRADGLASTIQASQQGGRASRIFGDVKQIGVVIDSEDDFDPGMRARKWSRLKEYKENGWSISRNVNPLEVVNMCKQLLGAGGLPLFANEG